jgi:thiamine biosynthesis protein ThiI
VRFFVAIIKNQKPRYREEIDFTMYNAVVCRYHEIATKGNNRSMFERCLVENIRHILRELPVPVKVERVRGRVWISPQESETFEQSTIDTIVSLLPDALGLESFSPAVKLPVDIDLIRETAAKLASPEILSFKETNGVVPRFRIRARRSNKRFAMTSRDIEIDLVSVIAASVGSGAFAINLDDADITLGCEIRDEFALLYFDVMQGPGGLPVGSNPRVLTLLSGGIDSPVAAYLTMKRGSPTDFITFHSAPYTPPETVKKVLNIAKVINRFQRNGKVHVINLAEFQKLVRDNCREKFRTVLYRRAMFRIAEMVAKSTNCHALVTGEALGQVASQTVVNLDTINRAINMLVLRPLIGADKLDAINLASKIGTLKLSEEQVPDSCVVFAPSNPATSAPVEAVEAEELQIPDYRKVLSRIVEEKETFVV